MSKSTVTPASTHDEARPKTKGRRAVRLDTADGQVAAKSAPERPRQRPARAQKRGEDVRARVLTAALECFGAFGYDGTSTRAVAERANVSHTLVLYHFGSKEELWTATMDGALASYASAVSQNLANEDGRSAGEVLKRFIEQFVRLSAQSPEIHRIMTMEGNQDTPRLRWVIENHLRSHFSQVRQVIRQAQEEGSVRQCDAARLYYYIIGGGGTLFTLSTEYKELTGRDVFSEAEIFRNIAFLYETVFI